MSQPGRQTAVTVVRFNRENPAAALEVCSVPKPSPGKGEVLCRIILRPINPSDVWQLISALKEVLYHWHLRCQLRLQVYSIQGIYPGFRPTTLPAVPGLEGEILQTEGKLPTYVAGDLKPVTQGLVASSLLGCC